MKFETDIIVSIAASRRGQAVILVIMYLETLLTGIKERQERNVRKRVLRIMFTIKTMYFLYTKCNRYIVTYTIPIYIVFINQLIIIRSSLLE
jgi:hypothetical protein